MPDMIWILSELFHVFNTFTFIPQNFHFCLDFTTPALKILSFSRALKLLMCWFFTTASKDLENYYFNQHSTLCEPSQTNGSPHYVDLTEVGSYQRKLNRYKSLCNVELQGSGVISPAHLSSLTATVYGKIQQEKSFFEEFLLCCNSFFLSQNNMLRANEKTK